MEAASLAARKASATLKRPAAAAGADPAKKAKKSEEDAAAPVKAVREKPSAELRAAMLKADVATRTEFHLKHGCTKCAWKKCSPSCWKARNMEIPAKPAGK